MLCYKDRIYCWHSATCTAECYLRLKREESQQAYERDLPVAYKDYRITNWCPGYEEVPEVLADWGKCYGCGIASTTATIKRDDKWWHKECLEEVSDE